MLRNLNPAKPEQVKMDLTGNLFNQKWLRKYRLLNKHYLVAIDATGVVSFDHKYCEHCLTKTSKNGKVTYFHYVLEAKLVTLDGLCLSLASEWIIFLRYCTRGVTGLSRYFETSFDGLNIFNP
ncbi:MAG: hypothetical protein LBC19_00235 [Tannerella sp.]|nr:hypothetical protein [Tannerella sp.]